MFAIIVNVMHSWSAKETPRSVDTSPDNSHLKAKEGDSKRPKTCSSRSPSKVKCSRENQQGT